MATVSNHERLELSRQKAKGLLGTLRDLAVIRTQVRNIHDAGLIHPIRTLGHSHMSSSSAVGEHIIVETEEEEVITLLKVAYNAFSNAEFEKGKDLLKQVSFLSTCQRCVRNITGIEKRIEEGDLYEARRRLEALISLIPAYYSVIEGEAELQGEEVGSEKLEAKMEESCGECAASEILEICNWDMRCIDHIIEFIEGRKKAGKEVHSDEVIQKAKEYQESS